MCSTAALRNVAPEAIARRSICTTRWASQRSSSTSSSPAGGVDRHVAVQASEVVEVGGVALALPRHHAVVRPGASRRGRRLGQQHVDGHRQSQLTDPLDLAELPAVLPEEAGCRVSRRDAAVAGRSRHALASRGRMLDPGLQGGPPVRPRDALEVGRDERADAAAAVGRIHHHVRVCVGGRVARGDHELRRRDRTPFLGGLVTRPEDEEEAARDGPRHRPVGKRVLAGLEHASRAVRRRVALVYQR